MSAAGGRERTEYRVRRTEGWQAVGRCAANGRDAVAPLPEGEARERQLGWHAVPTLPETGDDAPFGS